MSLNQNFTVKNNLNTLGSILSSGTDISTVFSPISLYTLVGSNSAVWSGGGNVATTVQSQSANNASVYSQVNNLSGSWVGGNAAYTTLTANSAAYLAVTAVNGTLNQVSASTTNGVITLSLPNSILTPGNLTVGGNLYVTGSATQVNQNTLNIGTPIIYLSEDNPGDAYDTGFVSHNVVGGVYGHTGLLRTHGIGNPGTWYLFSSMTTEPSANSVSSNTKTIDTLVANISGSVTGNFQQVPANSVIGNPTGSTANSQAIPASTTGLALLSATSASTAATTLGLGTTNTPTFNALTISNGTQTTNSNVFYGTATNTNALIVPTFNKTTYNTAKYVVQIKKSGGYSAAMEILVNYDTGGTPIWEGTVYGLLDTGSIFTNVDVATTGSTIDLSFTFNGNATYNVTVIGQAM
jgi:hypothetical protein